MAVAGTISPRHDPDALVRGVKRERLGLPTPIEIDGHHGFCVTYVHVTYAPEAGAAEESHQMFWLFPSADFSLLAPDVPAELHPSSRNSLAGCRCRGGQNPRRCGTFLEAAEKWRTPDWILLIV